MSVHLSSTRPTTARPLSSAHQSFRQTTGISRQSRPTTARPVTAGSTRHEGSFTIAVLEGRGIGREVGIAALDKDTGQVNLIQVCETSPK